MENLKKGGTFASRIEFTRALRSWCVGSFGDSKKYKAGKNTGSTIEYKCRDCGADDPSSPVNVRLSIHRVSVEGKKKAKGVPATITEWTACECEITAPSQTLVLPPVGTIFQTREEFTKSVQHYCDGNRRAKFKRTDRGNKFERKCTTKCCPGLVQVQCTLVRKPKVDGKGKDEGHTWGPPLTVMTSTECKPDCKEASGELTKECTLCRVVKPLSTFITGICCQVKGGGVYCESCLKDWLQRRPLHMNKWVGGSRSMLHKMVETGTGSDEQVWYRCPMFHCEWNKESAVICGNVHYKIADMVPFGFCGYEPIYDSGEFQRKFQELQEIQENQPPAMDAEDPGDVDQEAISAAIHSELLSAGNNESRLAIMMNQGVSEAEARVYLQQNGFWWYDENHQMEQEIIEIL
jgi:hypothetical protein